MGNSERSRKRASIGVAVASALFVVAGGMFLAVNPGWSRAEVSNPAAASTSAAPTEQAPSGSPIGVMARVEAVLRNWPSTLSQGQSVEEQQDENGDDEDLPWSDGPGAERTSDSARDFLGNMEDRGETDRDRSLQEEREALRQRLLDQGIEPDRARHLED